MDFKNVVALLDEKELDKLRSGVIDILLKQIEEDLNASNYYTITGEEVGGIVTDILTTKLEEMISDVIAKNELEIQTNILKGLGIERSKKEDE